MIVHSLLFLKYLGGQMPTLPTQLRGPWIKSILIYKIDFFINLEFTVRDLAQNLLYFFVLKQNMGKAN